jgi:predicted nucleic acid-binding Zn ribbon protein
MKCDACGAASDDSAKFCSQCGQAFSIKQQGSKLPFWNRPLSSTVIGTIILVLLVLGWNDIVQSVRYSQKLHTFQTSGFVFWSGILGAVLAPKKRRIVWFLSGLALSVPAMLLAGFIGGVLR